MRTPEASHGTRKRTHEIVVVLALLGLAWVVYEPANARPFDYVDFPENLLVLKVNSGVVEQFKAMSRVYADHGRWMPITHGLLVAQWSWFEAWTPGWQVLRFAIMGAVTILAFVLYRRLQLNVIGASAAAMFFIVSPAAAMGALRLSTPEPVGLLFLVIACHLALYPRTRNAPWLLAALLLAVMWTKEIMTVAFVFPLLLALSAREDGSLGRPRFSRNRLLPLFPSAAFLVAGSIPILWTWLSAPAGSFASRYGSKAISVGDVAGGSLAAWLPFAPVSTSTWITLVVVVAFLLLVVTGWKRALIPIERTPHRTWLLAMALAVPILGALVFAPWPFYLLVYALPFTLAGALLVGQAASSLLDARLLDRAIGKMCLTIMLTFSVAQTANEASRIRALHSAVADAVVRVAGTNDVDSVLVEVAAGQFDPRGNFGPRFRLYASMLGLRWPEVRDIRCGEEQPATRRVLLLRLNLMCQPDPLSQPTIAARYSRFDWPTPWPRQDSVTITFLGRAP